MKGANLSTTTRVWAAPDFDGLDNNLPTNLSGIQVTVDDRPPRSITSVPRRSVFRCRRESRARPSVRVMVNGVASNSVTAASRNQLTGHFPYYSGRHELRGGGLPGWQDRGRPIEWPGVPQRRPGDTVQLFATA